MVIRLLADANVEGHVARLASLMQSEYWRELWEHLEIQIVPFGDVGLASSDSDVAVWQCCQDNQLYLLTNNRNDDGPESLAATIRDQTRARSLPVFTFGDADEILRSPEYAQRVIESLFDHLLRIDVLLGTGRLYLP